MAQLANTLQLTPQAVRRHLDGLRAESLIDVRQKRHGVGRPTMVYFITERGEELAGRTYLQLLSRMVRHLEKLDARDVSGATGREVVSQVFSGVAEEVAADHRAEVHGETLDERINQASKALRQEGIVDDWEKHGDVFHLLNGDCPYLKLAEMSDAACSADRRSIELLLGTEVDQTTRIVDGAPCCEYVIRPQPVTLVEEAKEKG